MNPCDHQHPRREVGNHSTPPRSSPRIVVVGPQYTLIEVALVDLDAIDEMVELCP